MLQHTGDISMEMLSPPCLFDCALYNVLFVCALYNGVMLLGSLSVVEHAVAVCRYYGAVSLLCDEAGFLVDSKAEKMLSGLPADENGQLQVQAVLKALGVTDDSSFEALMDALSTDAYQEDQQGRQPDNAPPVLVHPAHVVQRLKAFVEAESVTPIGSPGLTSAGIDSPGVYSCVAVVCAHLPALGTAHALSMFWMNLVCPVSVCVSCQPLCGLNCTRYGLSSRGMQQQASSSRAWQQCP